MTDRGCILLWGEIKRSIGTYHWYSSPSIIVFELYLEVHIQRFVPQLRGLGQLVLLQNCYQQREQSSEQN